MVECLHTIKQTISCSFVEPKAMTAGGSADTRYPVLNRSSDYHGYWTGNGCFLSNLKQKTH